MIRLSGSGVGEIFFNTAPLGGMPQTYGDSIDEADPRVTSTIAGSSKPERLAQALEGTEMPLPEEVWSVLKIVAFSDEVSGAGRDYRPG